MINFITKKTVWGGIDHISPSGINGWVFCSNKKIDKVGLYYEDNLIQDYEINDYRDDIARKFNCIGFNGFRIEIDLNIIKDIKNKDSNFTIRTISDNKLFVKYLQYLPSKKETKKRLNQVLNKKYIGLRGYFDGIDKNKDILEGWAYQQNNGSDSNDIEVWIHCEGFRPLPIKCNKKRDDLHIKGKQLSCAFKQDVRWLPKSWVNKSIRICFDELGFLPLESNPENRILNLKEIKRNNLKNLSKYESSNELVKDLPLELKLYTKNTEFYKEFLDSLETKMDQLDSIKESYKNRLPWFFSLINFIKSKKEKYFKKEYIFNLKSIKDNKIPLEIFRTFKTLKSSGKNNDEIKLIIESNLFDPEFYSKQANLEKNNEDLIRHYLHEGWYKGYDPSSEFNTNFYLISNPDVKRTKVNPLVHYITNGKNEGRSPNGLIQLNKNDQKKVDEQHVEKVDLDNKIVSPGIKVIAFYLPQFHAIPENDEWWGKGFTEWTNVKPAKKNFDTHYQPHVPEQLGYYDLKDEKILLRQARLASLYGVNAFCFYFYWFNGKTLLEDPIKNINQFENINIDFCLCWANENWTRRWDGLENDILISQKHSEKDDIEFIKYVSKYFNSKRYLRVDNKPVLIVYKTDLLPDPKATAKRWRKWCLDNNIGEIYLIKTSAFDDVKPTSIDFDHVTEFAPHFKNISQYDKNDLKINKHFKGNLLRWKDLLDRSKNYEKIKDNYSRCINPSWDNTPRKKNKSIIWIGSQPRLFQYFAENSLRDTLENIKKTKGLMFINAWNEWGEGAHLEPDQKYGYGYLEALRQALIKTAINRKDLIHLDNNKYAFCIHAFYPDILPEILTKIESLNNKFLNKSKLFITTTSEKIDLCQEVIEKYSKIKLFQIIACENRGRDIKPFLKVLNQLYSEGFGNICKIHTKKSLHRADGKKWRNEVIDDLFSNETVDFVFQKFSKDKNSNIGLISPKDHLLPMSTYWGSNKKTVELMATRLGIPLKDIDKIPFAAGSMFWAKTYALLPLLGIVDMESFEFEKGQVDGTFAHAIERLFSIACHSCDFKLVDSLGNSLDSTNNQLFKYV